MQRIKKPNLYFRSAYFIDSLKARTRLAFTAIEKRIQKKQYVEFGLQPPESDTVRDYFRLNRSVAFEPGNNKADKFPWLLAVELEFPNSAEAFFHPFFDLLFGHVESSGDWISNFQKIPEKWILELESKGCSETAKEWRDLNASNSKRKHRKKTLSHIDRLSLVHLLMIRAQYTNDLFHKDGLSSYFNRSYLPIKEELKSLAATDGLDGLFILLALTEEAALIGDAQRFEFYRSSFLNSLEKINEYPGCKRLAKAILPYIQHHLDTQVILRKYHYTAIEGFGLPVTWKAFFNSSDQASEKNAE